MPSFRPWFDVEPKIETKVVTSGHPPPIAQRFGVRLFISFQASKVLTYINLNIIIYWEKS